MQKIYFEKRNGESNLERLSSQLKMATQLLPNGKYELTIARHTDKRSTNQNRLLMLWCNCIAQYITENSAISCTGADAKELMKMRFLATDTPYGKIARHTSKLTTNEMSNFLNNVQAYFETISGILLPQPSDLAWVDFERQFSY